MKTFFRIPWLFGRIEPIDLLKISIWLSVTITIVALLLSCGKDGSMGPQGIDGRPGIDGSTMLSGRGEPSDSAGQIGDFYIDLQHARLYGPKTSGGWIESYVDLKGTTGTQGPQGETGPQGIPGSQILSGSSQPNMSQGRVGDYYLNSNTGQLYGPKSTSSWGNAISLKGDKGDRGEKGEKGDTGASGADGSLILSGKGAPSKAIGKDGDYYLDKATVDFYGPKIDGKWGDPASLKGEKGDPGTDGSRILVGLKDPTQNIGNVGDFYLNRTTGDFFGPKSESGWNPNTPISLKGPKGDPGTANVVSSGWIPYNWLENPITNPQSRYVMHYTIPDETLRQVTTDGQLETFLNNGGVLLLYHKFELTSDGNHGYTVMQYPCIRASVQYTWEMSWASWQSVPPKNTLLIRSENILGHNIEFIFVDPMYNSFRYVLIPAGFQATALARGKVLKNLSYKEATEMFNLNL